MYTHGFLRLGKQNQKKYKTHRAINTRYKMQRKTQNDNQNIELSQRTIQGCDQEHPDSALVRQPWEGAEMTLEAWWLIYGQLQSTGCCIAKSVVRLCIPTLSTRTFGSSTQNRKHQLCRQQRVKSTLPFLLLSRAREILDTLVACVSGIVGEFHDKT